MSEVPILNEGQYKALRHFVRTESLTFADFGGVCDVLEHFGMNFATIESLHIRTLMEVTDSNGKKTAKLFCIPTKLAHDALMKYEALKQE